MIAAQNQPLVHVLSYCASPVLTCSALMVFQSIRAGFPTADIEVFDNGSHPEMVPRIQAAAGGVGATFTPMSARHFSDHLEWVLLQRAPDGRPLVLCDAEVVFFESVEGWEFGDALLAGRLMPRMAHTPQPVEAPRLHPSLIFVPDVAAMRAELAG